MLAMTNLREQLAIIAYRAYGDSVDWKNYQGLPIPAWDALGDAIREAWRVAAEAVSLAVAEDIMTWEQKRKHTERMLSLIPEAEANAALRQLADETEAELRVLGVRKANEALRQASEVAENAALRGLAAREDANGG